MPTSSITWSPEAIDAINVTLLHGDIEIAGCDDDMVTLEEGDERRRPSARCEIAGRWLLVQGAPGDRGETPLTLHLPRQKQWVVVASTIHGDIEISGLAARLDATTTHGDISVADCHGVLSVTTTAGDVTLENCRQSAAPEAPPLPRADEGAPEWPNSTVGTNGWIEERVERRLAAVATEVQQAVARIPKALHNAFGGQSPATDEGLIVQCGSGDIEMDDSDVDTCTVQMANGDVSLSGGRIARLRVSSSRGDISCDDVVPGTDWELETMHGDIGLTLPANVQARLDAATRHGEIRSDAPLVRVARPGPEPRHGMRMVGALGQTGEHVAQIRMATTRGDIRIDLGENIPLTAEACARPNHPETRVMDDGAVAGADAPAAKANAGGYQSEMAVLQALSEGTITADEAERLLRSMGG
jgi:hypothetical protein